MLSEMGPQSYKSYRADSRFAPVQWETPLLCNDVSHWLGANLKSALQDHFVEKKDLVIKGLGIQFGAGWNIISS